MDFTGENIAAIKRYAEWVYRGYEDMTLEEFEVAIKKMSDVEWGALWSKCLLHPDFD